MIPINFEKYFDGKAVWLGRRPVLVADSIDLTQEINWRAPSKMHGSYSKVWIFEEELFSYGKSWPLVLDEAIRLVGKNGHLIIRTRDCGHGTLFGLKSIIARRPGIIANLELQSKRTDGDAITVIELVRLNYEKYLSGGWTIGILSNGKKSANVHALAEQLLKISNGIQIEFVVAGPEKILSNGRALENNGNWGEHFEDELPRIGEKKRWIVDQATQPNIAIFHDRYQVDDNFFSGFEKYGMDFDYVTVSQRYASGNNFPAYIGFERQEMSWQRPQFDPLLKTLHDGHFINGGLIVLKTHTAKAHNFNSLLLHNEAEDVEYAFILRSVGIFPRMNTHSSAVTYGVPENYTETFIKIRPTVVVAAGSIKRSIPVRVALWLGRNLPLRIKHLIFKSNIYAKCQKYLHPH